MGRCLHYFVQLDEVGMPNQFQDVYLAGDSFYVGNIDNSGLLQDFDGDGFIRRYVYGRLDFTECPLAQRPSFVRNNTYPSS